MTRRGIISLLLLAVGACAGTQLMLDKGPHDSQLRVQVKGIEPAEGQLRIAVFGEPDGFPGAYEQATRVHSMPVTESDMEWVVEELPIGIWAVAILHDADADGQMARDWMGRPKEGWAVSNDARGSFGPPSFEDCAIELGREGLNIVLNMSY